MIRKQARQRRDYLYRRALMLKDAETNEKKAALKSALASGKPLDPSIAKDKSLRKDYQYDESRPDLTVNEELDLDDEYSQLSGIQDPRILVTTSRDPSSRLAAFSKEIRLLLPTSVRLNRGNLILDDLVQSCFKSRLGQRIVKILKHLFPPREPITNKTKIGNRVVTFVNNEDTIEVRHHVFVRTSYDSVELAEVGPRMTMRPFEIRAGTLENKEGDVEWHLSQYTRTGRKKEYL
ncbi:U3 small nucleolar ribonucleoprotein IMP4 [Colletotrichum fructicola]|nr:U3 small nucleolar ribonucleoprotein IMP4 [Colletotrichum fructicola]